MPPLPSDLRTHLERTVIAAPAIHEWATNTRMSAALLGAG